MIERILRTAIQRGIDVVNADTRYIVNLLTEVHDLSEEEALAVEQLWLNPQDKKHLGPPSVHHGYPHTQSKFPGYFIMLANEDVSMDFLGDEIDQFMDDPLDDRYGSPVQGAIWRHTFNVMVMSQHADVTLYYYQILKSFFVAQDGWIREQGVPTLTYSGGDLAPDKTWEPDVFYTRRFTVVAQTEYKQVVPDGLARAWQVAGIHVSAEGADDLDVGGVQTLVNPIDALEE